MNKQSLTVQKTVEVITLGNPEKAKNIWICIHGYGQQAQFFAKHFQHLADAGDYVIVPNGLNDYYLEGFSGRVGSNWMTSFNREQAIQDQIEYANAVYHQFVKPYTKAETKLHMLGFSQGAYTASRWASQSHLMAHTLVCWAGIPANEVLVDPWINKLKGMRLAMVRGNEDHFISDDRISAIQSSDWYNALAFEVFSFQGGHKMHASTFLKVVNWVNGL